jgi:hypothetical protein
MCTPWRAWGYVAERRSSLKEGLEPVDRMLAATSSSPSSSSRRTVDVHCRVKESCVDLAGNELGAAKGAFGTSVDKQWIEDNGLNDLVACGGRRFVEVYKF